MGQFTELNNISIAELCIYIPSLFVAILLSIRYGFGRNAGWLFLIIFSLVRIVGAVFNPASIKNPSSIALIIGANTLQTISLSPLLMVMLALLNRVLESTRHARHTCITPRHIRLVQLLVLLSLILSIIGGVKTGSLINNAISNGGPIMFTASTESKVGTGIMIVCYVLLAIATAFTASQISAVSSEEKRLLWLTQFRYRLF